MKTDNLWQCCENCHYSIMNGMTHYHSDQLECHKSVPVAIEKKAEWPIVEKKNWCDKWDWQGADPKPVNPTPKEQA